MEQASHSHTSALKQDLQGLILTLTSVTVILVQLIDFSEVALK